MKQAAKQLEGEFLQTGQKLLQDPSPARNQVLTDANSVPEELTQRPPLLAVLGSCSLVPTEAWP